eukprot:2938314-Rhodomonas_salina.1
MSGTDIAYGELSTYERATQCPVPSYCMVLCDAQYGAMRCPLLPESMVLCGARYSQSVVCYAIQFRGTDAAYGASSTPVALPFPRAAVQGTK